MVTLHGLIHRLKTENHTVSQDKQHNMKVLFSSFPKSGHTAWFDPKTKVENHTVSQNKQHHMKVQLRRMVIVWNNGTLYMDTDLEQAQQERERTTTVTNKQNNERTTTVTTKVTEK